MKWVLSGRQMLAAAIVLLLFAVVAATASADTRSARSARPAFGGTPPMWIVHPYLEDTGSRMVLRAQVFVDPFRRPDALLPSQRHLRAKKDRLIFHVVVARRRYADVKRPRAVNLLPARARLADVVKTVRVDRLGVVDLRVALDAQTSNMLRRMSFRQRQTAMAITVAHLKDTFQGRRNTAAWGMTQTNDAGLQPSRASADERWHLLRFAKRQIRIDLRRINVVPKARPTGRWAGDSPMYNYVYLTNSTPFQQEIEFNPNIQCMWTGAAQQYPAAQLATIPSGGVLQMAYVLEPNPYAAPGGTTWAGLNGATNGMNAPGTQVSLTEDLVGSATVFGESLLESTSDKEFYSEAGAAAAVGGAAIKFMTNFIADAEVSGTCSSDAAEYPETFGVTSTVTGFGTQGSITPWSTPGAPVTYTAPSTWNVTQPIPAPLDTQYWDDTGQTDPAPAVLPASQCVGTVNANGQSCYWTGNTTVGTQSGGSTTGSCGDPAENPSPSNWCSFVYGALQPMLGAQTAATYYWNGGQPAYMVSNNAQPNTYVGGSASFQGGLFQNVGPNPGLPGDAWCWGNGLMGVINCSYLNAGNASQIANYNPMGAMNIQLTYLTTPQYTSGLYTGLAANQSGNPTPLVTVQAGKSPSGESGINITCDLSPIAPYLSLPFAPGGAKTTVLSGTQVLNTAVNGSGSMPTGSWAVNFYGLDADGNFVYYNPMPGTVPADQTGVTSTSASIYALGPNASNTTTAFNATSAQYPTGFLPNSALDNMQTIGNMDTKKISTLSAVGCSVVPSIALTGLDITGDNATVAAAYGQINEQGNGWPMPGNHTGWPASLYTPYNAYTNYQWQWPVEQVNVAFQGPPVVNTTPVDCMKAANGDRSCAPATS